jgi:hypothetical protein
MRLMAALALVISLVVLLTQNTQVNAQAAQAFSIVGGAPVATCPVLPVTAATLCGGTDDIMVAWPGDKAYTSLKALKTGGSVSLTLNGTTKQLPATFQLINNAATVTAQ